MILPPRLWDYLNNGEVPTIVRRRRVVDRQDTAGGYRGSGGVGDFFQWLERRSLDQVRPVPETTPDIAAV